MADFTTQAGSGGASVPPDSLFVELTAPVIAGAPVIPTNGGVGPAIATSAAAARRVGLACASCNAGNKAFIKYTGPLTLTADEWDAVAGTEGGLVRGSAYYVSATSGRLTSTAPASPNFVAPCGIALNALTLMIGSVNPVVGA